MENSSDNKSPNNKNTSSETKEYKFGGIQEYSLEKIEDEILNESLYLDVFAGSDIVFKENIKVVSGVLPKLLAIDCISYDYNNIQFAHKKFPESKQIGVVANQIAEHFPELVKKDESGNLHVNYSQLSTIAIQAAKELHDALDVTNERLLKLENLVKQLTNKSHQ